MNTGKVEGRTCTAGIVCKLEDDSLGELKLSNIYYLEDQGINLSNSYIATNNVSKKTLDELKLSSSYINWQDYDTYWEIEEINGIKRLPILKSTNFKYTKLSLNNNYSLTSTINIYNYLTPTKEAIKNIKYSVNNSSIVSIDNTGKIVPIKTGTTTLSIESYYDGFTSTITINSIVLTDITSTTYTIDSSRRLIYLFEPTEVKDFYLNISNNTGKVMSNETILESGKIGTGMMIDNYTIILRGDVTGDGLVKVNDVMRISQYTVEGTGLENQYHLLAADVTNDSLVKVNDVMRISKYTVEGGQL